MHPYGKILLKFDFLRENGKTGKGYPLPVFHILAQNSLYVNIGGRDPGHFKDAVKLFSGRSEEI